MVSEQKQKQKLRSKQKRKEKRSVKNLQRDKSLTTDDREYLIHIISRLKVPFEDDEEKELFAGNVLSTIGGREVDIMQTPVGVKCLEQVIPLSPVSAVEALLVAALPSVKILTCHQFGSFSLQALISCAVNKSQDLPTSGENAGIQSACESVIKVILNNSEEYISHNYASHVMRTALMAASGVWFNATDTESNKNPITNNSIENVKSVARRLQTNPQLLELSVSEHSSAVLQTLLRILSELDTGVCDVFLCELTSAVFSQLHSLTLTQPLCRLLETSAQSATTQPAWEKLWEAVFKGNVMEFSKHPLANFTIQRLLDCCTHKSQVSCIAEEVLPDLESIYEVGNTGVILSLTKASSKFNVKQSTLIKSLCSTLGCDSADLFSSLLHMKTDKSKLSLHGSLIIQNLLHFKKNSKIVLGILSEETPALVSMCSDNTGCHVIDAYMSTTTINQEHRTQLLHKLKGSLFYLACSKHGSRAVDALWSSSSSDDQLLIMSQLSTHHSSLQSHLYGKFICTNSNMKLYIKDEEEWKQSLRKRKATQDMFKDILDTTEVPVKRKKSNKVPSVGGDAVSDKSHTDTHGDYG